MSSPRRCRDSKHSLTGSGTTLTGTFANEFLVISEAGDILVSGGLGLDNSQRNELPFVAVDYGLGLPVDMEELDARVTTAWKIAPQPHLADLCSVQ